MFPIMDSSTNLKKNHISHLSSSVTTGKSHNKDVDTDGMYKGPQISPMFTSGTLSPKCPENNLLSSVLKRVSTLEGYLEKSKKRLKQALNVIREKDNEIVRLKEQIRLLEDDQKTRTTYPHASVNDVSALVTLTESLQTRITAVENFLKEDPYSWYKKDQIMSTDHICQCSLENQECPDLDVLLQQINELNFEAGEVHICQNTKQGATFKGCPTLSLTFYANGMQLDGHPFRDYSDLRTQFFIKDILDGFFPSELQCEYPRGVLFNVCDNRTVTYCENDEIDSIFKGRGFRLDVKSDNVGQKSSSHMISSGEDTKSEKQKCCSHIGNLQASCECLANQLMQLNKDFYKRRNPDLLATGTGGGDGTYSMYRQTNMEKCTSPNVTIKDGQVCSKKISTYKKKQITQENASGIKHLNPSTKLTKSCVQLKIRSIKDKDLFILTMHTSEPIGKLRSYLPNEVKDCSIMHFKDNYNRIYLNDNQLTLKECGIMKNSVLLLCKPELTEEK